ncbi:UrcA family protein [Brevundimonas staleyi]|uniref:UrcA family protein n=1 Tax=Brevundimonas staleyi TaxID=74326 RepID=A0ABW0FRM4_9CAUL
MLLSALVVATALSQTPAPRMRVAIQDLDLDRPEHVEILVRRTRAASRDYCARHIAVVTPDRMGTPAVCERNMATLAFHALPDHARDSLIRSGQSRRFR